MRAPNKEQVNVADDPQRLGCVTASRVHDLMSKTKTGYSKTREDYMRELVGQRLTGKREKQFTSAAMQRGIDLEPEAKEAYEARTGLFVEDPPFMLHPKILMFGASPDGLIELDGDLMGLLEIKCMGQKNHVDFMLAKRIPIRYQRQMIAQCSCTGARIVDFAAFNPDFPQGCDFVVQRFEPSEEQIIELEEEVVLFLEELDKMETQLRNLKNGK